MDEGEYHAAMERSNRLPDVSALRRDLVAAGYTPMPLFGKAPPSLRQERRQEGPGRLAAPRGRDGRADRRLGGALAGRASTPASSPDRAGARYRHSQRGGCDRDRGSGRASASRSTASSWCGSASRPSARSCFAPTTPFTKILANVTAPNGGAAEKIEFLGDGQQIVVAGIHPDTKAPYRWHGGEPGRSAARICP